MLKHTSMRSLINKTKLLLRKISFVLIFLAGLLFTSSGCTRSIAWEDTVAVLGEGNVWAESNLFTGQIMGHTTAAKYRDKYTYFRVIYRDYECGKYPTELAKKVGYNVVGNSICLAEFEVRAVSLDPTREHLYSGYSGRTLTGKAGLQKLAKDRLKPGDLIEVITSPDWGYNIKLAEDINGDPLIPGKDFTPSASYVVVKVICSQHDPNFEQCFEREQRAYFCADRPDLCSNLGATASLYTHFIGYYDTAEEYFTERGLPYDKCLLTVSCTDEALLEHFYPSLESYKTGKTSATHALTSN